MSHASLNFEWAEFNGPAVSRVINAAAKRGLFMAGQHILNVSNRQVPHEDGDLERSGTVTEASGSELEVAVSYDTPYAVRQHEDLSLRHDAGRNAKYLENACRKERGTAGRIVAQAMRQQIGD